MNTRTENKFDANNPHFIHKVPIDGVKAGLWLSARNVMGAMNCGRCVGSVLQVNKCTSSCNAASAITVAGCQGSS